MCGIGGWISARAIDDGDAAAEAESLLRFIRDRGPDGEGRYFALGNRLGLVHTRLAIIDPLARSDQPLADEASGAVITFNGEIYNYVALKAQLEAGGEQFRTNSDTEVLLKGYLRHGVGFFRKLRGMYAFAIFDPRASCVVVHRDPFGIKPLYIGARAHTVAFSSSPTAVATALGNPELDPAAAVSLAVLGCVLEPLSKWSGVGALESKTAVVWTFAGGRWSEQRVQIEPEFPWDQIESDRGGHLAELEEVLADSVAAHLTANVPVAVFQSAGLDSTLISSLAARSTPPPTLLTIGFEEFRGTFQDEVPQAIETARALGLGHRFVYVDRSQFLQIQDHYFEHMESPTFDGINTALVSWFCRRQNIKAALSGLGADELLGGYASMAQLPKLARGLRWLEAAGLGGIVKPVARTATHVNRRISPKLAHIDAYRGSFERMYLLRRSCFAVEELPSVLDRDIVLAGERRFWDAYTNASANCHSEDGAGVRTLERDIYLRNVLLKDADWVGMAYGVEIRAPFVDVPLYRRLCTRENYSSLTKSDLGKVILRLQPNFIAAVNRKKTGFAVPHLSWTGREAGLGRQTPGGAAGVRAWNRHVLKRCFADWAMA
jgi:asparagine synthase (glutamine-hydrolysing)